MGWQPGASVETLKQRAQLLEGIRRYFRQEGVLEVETPLLSRAGNTDPAFALMTAKPVATGGDYYLQTSPELPMKRLLSAGSGSIYQVCKAFRQDESGRLHNPEFTLLEWYRVGYHHHQLMDDVEVLLQTVMPAIGGFARYGYCDLFEEHVGLHPLDASDAALQAAAEGDGVVIPGNVERDWLLQVLFEHHVVPFLEQAGAVFVYDYPASQASLARISDIDKRVAERFELYIDGIELANGFHELRDATEQRQRFAADQDKRQKTGQPVPLMDLAFLEALEAGMPACSGVAVGLDRLLMLLTGTDQITGVLAFPIADA